RWNMNGLLKGKEAGAAWYSPRPANSWGSRSQNEIPFGIVEVGARPEIPAPAPTREPSYPAVTTPSTTPDLADIPPDRRPRHIAIIMDGNGRWAQRRQLPRIEGHRRGVASVRRSV